MPDFGRPSLETSRDRRLTMAEYDHLPPALRGWLAGARLQWSPVSAHRAWRRAMRRALWRKGAALARMDALEAEMIARDLPAGTGPADREAGPGAAG